MDFLCELLMQGALLGVVGIALLDCQRDSQTAMASLPELVVQGSLTGLLVLLLLDYYFYFSGWSWSNQQNATPIPRKQHRPLPPNRWASSSLSPTMGRHLERRGVLL